MQFWRTYWGYRLCSLLGHAQPVRLLQEGNEHCDCGADHTYLGCPRCEVALECSP